MNIEQRSIESIKPYDKNARKNADAIAAVAGSITEFGFRQPIVIDESGVIIVGHTRYLAAKHLGLATVPVHVAVGLSPAQAKAYRIADNATGGIATWDMDLLPIEIKELEGLDFDIDLLRFLADELAEIMAPQGNVGLTDPDDIPEPPDEPVTRPGDVWIMGEHRLMCGDSAKPEDVDRLLGGAPIHICNTDPPYCVNVEPRSNNAIAAGLSSFPAAKGSGQHHQRFDVARHPGKAKGTTRKMRAKDRPLQNDFLSDQDFDTLLHAWFGNISRVLLPGRAFYCWGGYANLGNYPPVIKKSGLYFSQGIVWDKQWPVLTRKDFMGAFEIAFYGWKEGAAHQFFGPANVADLWHVKKMSHTETVHLTQKPVELAARALAYSSKPGENCLDLFGGSGSTLIACEQQGQRAYLLEIDALYCDVILARWSAFTSRDPVLKRTGETFSALNAKRSGREKTPEPSGVGGEA